MLKFSHMNATIEGLSVPYRPTKTILEYSELIRSDEDGECWGVTSSPALHDKQQSSYEDYFTQFGRGLIRSALKEKKERGLHSTFLDLAGGDGSAARELKQKGLIDTGLTVSLTDLRSSELKKLDRGIGIEYFSGDLFTRAVWKQIDEWVRNNTRSGGFDLIVCRPVAGYPSSPRPSAAVYNSLLRRIWQQLTPHDGIFLGEGPYLNAVDQPYVSDYLHENSNFPGAEVKSIFSQSIVRDFKLEKLMIKKSLSCNFDLLV